MTRPDMLEQPAGWPTLRAWLHGRRLSISAWLATLALLLLSLTQPAQELEWLYNDNGIAIQHLQIVYLLLALLLAVVVIFEPQLRREALESHALGLLAVASTVICFLVVRFIKPDEAWRFFRSPRMLWFVIIHAIFLCALALLLALDRPQEAVSRRLQRYAFIPVMLGGLVVLALHTLSVGDFMTLDQPDEMWLASIAVNYARDGSFYSSYLTSAFGNPDPFLPRYYLVMGEWVRLLHDTSLSNLRAFSLLVAGIGVALTAAILLRQAGLSLFQKVAGIVVMLGISPLVRAAHNLRMDVGLSIYGALLLFGLLGFLRDKRSRWLLVLGGALALGMELIPPLALPVNGVIGCALIIQAVWRRVAWKQVFLYAGICFLACLIYAALRFLPDIPQNVQNYLNYARTYYSGGITIDLTRISDHLRESAVLSPIESIITVAVLAFAWRNNRILMVISGAVIFLSLTIRSASYGYLAIFAPFIAYFAAHALRSRAAVVLGVFVLLPALLSVPIFDMSTALDTRSNTRLLAEVDLLTWRVPSGATVWGDTVFWFTLRDQVEFIGRPGPSHVARARGLTLLEAVKDLGVSVVICHSEDEEMCSIGQELYGQPYEFVTTDARYLMYSPLGSQ